MNSRISKQEDEGRFNMAIQLEVYRILQSCYERKILEMILADRSYSLTFMGLKVFLLFLDC